VSASAPQSDLPAWAPSRPAGAAWAIAPFAAALVGGALVGLAAPQVGPLARLEVAATWVALGAWALAPLWWVFDLARHFPVQFLLASLGAIGALVTAGGTSAAWTVAALFPAAWWALAVAPWIGVAPGSQAEPSPAGSRSLSLFYANVLTESRAAGALARLIARADADVVALVEVDQAWLDSLDLAALGYPHSVLAPRPDHFGVALASRRRLSDASVLDPAGRGMPAVRARVALDEGGCGLDLVVAHTMPPKGPGRARMLQAQILALAEVARAAGPALALVGDLNVTPWCTGYRQLLAAAGLADGRRGHGLAATWPASLPWWLRLPIDQVLLGKAVTAPGLELGPAYGSDHRPIRLELLVGCRTRVPDRPSGDGHVG
jgi:endonuclease/exonuclease/phosphatase (EEP) superfamily protein YafD